MKVRVYLEKNLTYYISLWICILFGLVFIILPFFEGIICDGSLSKIILSFISGLFFFIFGIYVLFLKKEFSYILRGIEKIEKLERGKKNERIF